MIRWALGLVLVMAQFGLMGRNPATTSYDIQVIDNGQFLASESVNIRLSLSTKMDGEAAYTEVHTTNTDAQGKASVLIGDGKAIKGDFDQLDLATGSYFVKVEYGLASTGMYRLLSHSRLLSVTRVQKWLFGKEKFNTVLTIIIVIWLGIIVYLLTMGRRISRLENDLKKIEQEGGN